MKFRPVAHDFTDSCERKASFCICELYSDSIVLAAVIDAEYNLTNNTTKLAEKFLMQSKIPAGKIVTEEIRYHELDSLIDSADDNNFIFSSSQFLETCRINTDLARSRRTLEDRIISKKSTVQSLKTVAWKNLCDTDLNAEIEKICTPPTITKDILWHPVHYMFRCDSEENVQPIVEGTLSLLREKNRLISARYLNYSAPTLSGDSNIEQLRSMYETLGGGAAVLSFFGFQPAEDEYITSSETVVSKICELALEFRKKVLTVFCLNKADEKTRTIIYGCMGGTSLIEISTASVNFMTARKHLAAMAKENGLKPDKKLYASFTDPAALYNGSDLNKAFDSWYHLTLKTKIFPQYASVSTSRAVAAKAPPKGSAFDDLEHMVGLSEAKKIINDALNYYKIQKIYGERGIVSERPAMHMVFTGNPGTAKTTAARLFARIMKENNLLSVGDIVEVGRADLVGKYVGWTAKIVKDKFKAAKGSVLFIDEAYSLVDDRNGLYGDEAINTIVQEMENQREDMMVIFAGYPDKMKEFLDKNPGLRSRIAFHVPFPDYSPFELCSILELMCEKQKVRIGEDAKENLYRIFGQAVKQQGFGNGRFVRNLLESAKLRQASRLVKTNCEKITDDELFTLTAEDFEYTPQTPRLPQKSILGFCG